MLFFIFITGNFILKSVYQRPHFHFNLSQRGFEPLIGDFNHNGYMDLILDMIDTVEYDQRGFYFLEFLPDSGFKIRDSIMSSHLYHDKIALGSVGDFDNNGKTDFIWEKDTFDTTIGGYRRILIINESDSLDSYPLKNVWRDTISASIFGVYDVNNDGLAEIFLLSDIRSVLRACGDNFYCVVGYWDNRVGSIFVGNYGYAFLDGDTLIDHLRWHENKYYVIEYFSDVYDSVVFEANLWGVNTQDGVLTEDMDQDGFGEAVLKDLIFPDALHRVIIIEAIGDNEYEVKKIFEFNIGPITDRGRSAGGDVDGDGVPEAVIEMREQIKIIKAFDNDSFYVWKTIYVPFIYSQIGIYDLDNNGINDIIIIGRNKILVYEWSTNVEEVSWNSDDFFLKRNIIKSLSEIKYKNSLIIDISGRKTYLPVSKKTEFLKNGIYFIKLKNSPKYIKIIKIR